MLKKQAAPSIGGGKFFGGNNYDIILDGDAIRPTIFKGTWFEGTATSVIGQLNAPSVLFLQGLMFEDCLFQPKASAEGGGLVAMNN